MPNDLSNQARASRSPRPQAHEAVLRFVLVFVVTHLLVTIAHAVAHQALGVVLALPDLIFVIVVVLISPLLAVGLLLGGTRRLGLVVLSLSMFASLFFGLHHHFLAMGPDHVHSQPSSSWGLIFVLTAYGLLVTEAIGTCASVYLLWITEQFRSKAARF